jgi:hypothetical protein
MKVTLESTSKIVFLQTEAGTIQARIWEGQTASGIACHAFITRIAVHKALDSAEFERELTECAPPSRAVDRAYPDVVSLRQVL